MAGRTRNAGTTETTCPDSDRESRGRRAIQKGDLTAFTAAGPSAAQGVLSRNAERAGAAAATCADCTADRGNPEAGLLPLNSLIDLLNQHRSHLHPSEIDALHAVELAGQISGDEVAHISKNPPFASSYPTK
jgi:hypothetical protein